MSLQMNTMDSQALFDYTSEKLKTKIATHLIPERLKDQQYDVKAGARICEIMYRGLCGSDAASYDRAVDNFIALSQEFLNLQAELERTGKYHHGSFQVVKREIYDNPAVMEGRYLPGLLLSQAFWINHQKILRFFNDVFCSSSSVSSSSGMVL